MSDEASRGEEEIKRSRNTSTPPRVNNSQEGMSTTPVEAQVTAEQKTASEVRGKDKDSK